MPGVDRRDGADLIVVGGSVGGLAAAVTAADRGCHVVVVERTKELGGGAAAAGEAVIAAGSRWQREAGIEDDAARLAADLLGAGAPAGRAPLLHALANQSAVLVEWLADRCGTTLQLVPPNPATPGPARRHAAEQGGASLVAALARLVSRHHRIRVRLATEATGLLRDEGGGVTGVAVKGDRRSPPTVSGRVLLACGGFAADDALVAEHCPSAAGLPVGGTTTASGDGLRFALAAGARTAGLDRCAVTALLALPVQLAAPAAMLALGAVLVNQAGQRFASATDDGPALAGEVRAQPGHMAYLVFDDRIATVVGADPFVEHVLLPRAARRGATTADLAKQFELDPEGIADSVAATTLVPPLRAIRVTGARLRTLGGVVVDAQARVLDAAGQPISGLYAAGGVVESLGVEPDLVALHALGLGRLAALDVIAVAAAAADA